MSRKFIVHFLIGIALLVSSCNLTKRVPQGDRLYLGGKVRIDDKMARKKERKSLEEDLTELLRPKPNSSILGLRPKLWIYNITGNTKRGLGKWLKKFAEPPVLFSSVRVDYNRDLVSNRLQNRGYFRSKVTVDTILGRRKARLVYHATTGRQYLISKVVFETDSSELGKAVKATEPYTILQEGDSYNLDVIKTERERIDGQLKEHGFYYFSPDDIIVQVDSSNKNYETDLYLRIKENIPVKAKNIYRINNIYIFPNFRPADTTRSRLESARQYEDFYVIDPRKTFKPKIFAYTMFFNRGDVYNRTDHNLSLNRLVTLGTFRFVKNRFQEVDSTGLSLLDVYYYLNPYRRKSLRAEITGRTNSANFTGSELTLSWRNRNTFKGAELLTVSAYGGADVQVSGVNKGNNIYRIGAEVNLNIPHFVSPFNLRSTSAYIPRTKITLGYDLLRRASSYTLNSFRTSFGYNWKESSRKEHQLTIFGINYVQPSQITPAYADSARKYPTYRNAIQRQFTVGPIYNFNYSSIGETYRTNTWYYNGNLDLSGNILGLLTGADIRAKGPKKIFGSGFAQYIRIENELRYYRKLSKTSQWANRLIFGYGFTYGNGNGSEIGNPSLSFENTNPISLPYVKQFFIGGTNSIRAFRARSLGPGTFPPPPTNINILAADESGDVKLEMNTEYRPKLFSIVNGALFIDAGNIWTLSTDPGRPGSKFTGSFLKELAVGTGAGLRLDLSFLILRTDLAFPIRKPWLPEGHRWVIDQINFGSKTWRRENLVFNLAIGYPF